MSIRNPCPSEEFPTPAKRPTYSLLAKDKVKQILKYSVPRWEESLKTFMEGITENDII